MNISIVIAAHNEARHIEHKLRTLLAQDYEPASLQIILASDGSTDDTVACARKVIDPRITILDLPGSAYEEIERTVFAQNRSGLAGVKRRLLLALRGLAEARARALTDPHPPPRGGSATKETS